MGPWVPGSFDTHTLLSVHMGYKPCRTFLSEAEFIKTDVRSPVPIPKNLTVFPREGEPPGWIRCCSKLSICSSICWSKLVCVNWCRGIKARNENNDHASQISDQEIVILFSLCSVRLAWNPLKNHNYKVVHLHRCCVFWSLGVCTTKGLGSRAHEQCVHTNKSKLGWHLLSFNPSGEKLWFETRFSLSLGAFGELLRTDTEVNGVLATLGVFTLFTSRLHCPAKSATISAQNRLKLFVFIFSSLSCNELYRLLGFAVLKNLNLLKFCPQLCPRRHVAHLHRVGGWECDRESQ